MDDSNVNYKEMYLELMRATEKAINILIQAQRDCEEKYISERRRRHRRIKTRQRPCHCAFRAAAGSFFVPKF